jgi:hypothetical protein
MKQKLLTRLVLASLVGAAAVGVQAGQIQASSVSIAREVITTDTQAVTSPSISYRSNFPSSVHAGCRRMGYVACQHRSRYFCD